MARHSSCDEVIRALETPNWAGRAKVAERLARLYCEDALASDDRDAIEDAFRGLCYDAVPVVRRVLAEALKRRPDVPRDIALTLAQDKPEVAIPFLASSPSLRPDDLLVLVRDHPGAHRRAIARRRDLPRDVVDALHRCGDEELILTLIGDGRLPSTPPAPARGRRTAARAFADAAN